MLSDQLYFERFHPVAPMVHKQRYFSWAGQESLSWPRACLRSAMRTIAAATSVAFKAHSQTLYQETRRMLKDTDTAQSSEELGWSPYGAAMVPVEKIQALIILAHYELLCHTQHKAMMTASRVFRLVQLARLYEVDKLDGSMAGSEDFVTTEEKRRAFWMAFSLDRFLCARDDLPLTLREEMVRRLFFSAGWMPTSSYFLLPILTILLYQMSTRLPAPEENFQQNLPTLPAFLSEALASNDSSNLSPFAECMVLATLYGHCTSHRRESLITLRDQAGQDSNDFWSRHEWLANSLENRIQQLEKGSRHSMVDLDPMVNFTHMVAHSTMIHLYGTARMCPWHTLNYQSIASAYEERAHIASMELIQLSYAVGCFSSLKVRLFIYIRHLRRRAQG